MSPGTKSSNRREIPMDVVIHLDRDPHTLTDAELAASVRSVYDSRHDARKAANDRVSADLGHSVTINGVTYSSKSRAMKALGWSFQKLTKTLAEQKD